MSKEKLPTEPASADQSGAANDSERVPTDGRDWLFLLLSVGIAALLAIGTSLVSKFAGDAFWPYMASAAWYGAHRPASTFWALSTKIAGSPGIIAWTRSEPISWKWQASARPL